MDLYTPPSVAYGGAYSIRPYNRVCAILRNTDAISQPDTCCPSKNHPVFVPLRGRLWGVFDTPLQAGTCGPSKNCPVFVPFGTACGAYAIRPYDRVRAILRNTDAILRPGTYGPSKNYPVFVPYGAVCGGVCDTPLRLDTCGPPKNCPVFVSFGAVCGVYAIHPYDRYVRPFKKLSRFRPLRGRLWGVLHTPLQSGTCDPSKYRCDSPTGYWLSYEIRMCFPDRRQLRVGEVGRWGLPLAGEVGVNEFGEEEDDDQNNDNKGA